MTDVKLGKRTRQLPNGATETAIVCPSCGAEFFQFKQNCISLVPCPECGWRHDHPLADQYKRYRKK